MSKRRLSRKAARQDRILTLGLINAAATGVAAAPLVGFPWWVGPSALVVVGISAGLRKVLMEEAEREALYTPAPERRKNPQPPATTLTPQRRKDDIHTDV